MQQLCKYRFRPAAIIQSLHSFFKVGQHGLNSLFQKAKVTFIFYAIVMKLIALLFFFCGREHMSVQKN